MVVPPPNSPITSESPSSPERNPAILDTGVPHLQENAPP